MYQKPGSFLNPLSFLIFLTIFSISSASSLVNDFFLDNISFQKSFEFFSNSLTIIFNKIDIFILFFSAKVLKSFQVSSSTFLMHFVSIEYNSYTLWRQNA